MTPDPKDSGPLLPAEGAAHAGPGVPRGGAPSRNRRVSALRSRLGCFVFGARRGLPALGIAGAYALFFSWLLSAPQLDSAALAEALAVPDSPHWQPPDARHRLGTTGTGTDLLDLSRAALARSAVLAALGAALAAALASLGYFLLHRLPRTATSLAASARGAAWAPLAVFSVVGAASGNLFFLYGSVLFCLAFALFGDFVAWCGPGRPRSDLVAAQCLGIPRQRIALRRLSGRLLPWAVGTVATLLPRLMLLEMALSFSGLVGFPPSLGTIIAHGRDTMIEAPWIAIYPGLFAAAAVAAFSILGEFTAPRALRAKLWL